MTAPLRVESSGVDVLFSDHALSRMNERGVPVSTIVDALNAEPTKLRAAVAMDTHAPLRFGPITLVLRCMGPAMVLVLTVYPGATWRTRKKAPK